MLLETIATGATPLDMSELSGKTAVIVGAASGIGLGLARRFKAEGMRLVLADFDAAALEDACRELEVHGIVADIREPESMKHLADEAAQHLGRIHLLCSNAGVSRMAG